MGERRADGDIGPYMMHKTNRMGPHKSPAERVLWGEEEPQSERAFAF